MKNTYRQIGNIIEIDIERKNGQRYTAIIDADDFYLVANQSTWCISMGRKTKVPSQNMYVANGGRLLLNRLIAGEPEGKVVGFRNGNHLDCRKANLVITDAAGLAQQRLYDLPKGNKARGIVLLPSGRWMARIRHKTKHQSKAFDTFKEAKQWQADILRSYGLEITKNGRRVLPSNV